jgi:anthranilate phosphoribosyltransferase
VLPRRQMLGVYNLKLARMYHYLYEQSDVEFAVVTSLDGYDEISLTADFKVFTRGGEAIYTPEELGFVRALQSDLFGGDTVAEAAAIFDAVLDGSATAAQKNAVIANAAFAIRTAEPTMPVNNALAVARTSIESGRTLETFKKFVELNS